MPREFDPMVGQFPDSNIPCYKCKNREIVIVEINGKKKDVGAPKSYCKAYPKIYSNGKPHGVLFLGEKCDYYEKANV